MKEKIAVIGAGPAGLTAGLALQDRGFTNITVFGRFEEAQLETKKVGGLTTDVAACLLHTGYDHTVKKLVRRFGLHLEYMTEPADIVNHKLEFLKKGTSEKLKIYGLILYYLFFYWGWWIWHPTRFQQYYQMSMETYLTKRGLKHLAKSYVMGPGGVSQGYGFLDEVSAFHAFRWFRPRLFITPLLSKYKRGVSTIKEGYEVLFRKILDRFDYRAVKIESIQPENNQVRLKTQTGDTLYFDQVIIACPLDEISFPAQEIIQKQDLTATALFSYLFTSPTPSPFKSRAYIADYIHQKCKDKTLVLRNIGQTKSKESLYWAVGYKAEGTTLEKLKQAIEHQMQEELGIVVQKVHFFRTFRYNLRFNSAAIRERKPLAVQELQGKDHIWYSGGLLSHWDVSSIYEFNRALINKFWFQTQGKGLAKYPTYLIRAFLSRIRML